MSDTQSRDQVQSLAAGAAAGAGLLAFLAAMATRRAPRWLRVTVILGLLATAFGAGIFAYRYSKQPTTLTVAAGSLDGDAPKLMEAIAARLAVTNAPVRLKVVDELTAADATSSFAAGKTDLAVIRPDVGDLSSARTLMIVARAVVLIIALPGSNVTSMDNLKGKTVGVIGGAMNHSVVQVLTREYDLERARTRFRDMLPAEVPQAVQAKQVQALLLVVPISENYIGRIRDTLRATKGKVALVPIESAGAIANIQRAYESYELPKGTIRGSPAVPDEDLTTLRLPLYLVANKKISDDVAGALVKAVFDARRELSKEHPLLAQIAEPDKDKDAFIPIHPGAAQYFEDEQKSFFDKYGDQLFYGSMLLGMLTSMLAGVWRYMLKGDPKPLQERPLSRLFALMDRVREARDETELAQAEQEIDEILKLQLQQCAPGEIDAGEAAAVSLATHRLEHLVSQRRAALRSGVGSTSIVRAV
ncbi:MAG: ABC transporter substrate-binding protein [Xanthobacteraceae bacterium]|nr:ABC transporter substrate-binding protein [Xanthobacteraceae bacterium]